MSDQEHSVTLNHPRLYDLSTGLLFAGTRRRAYRRLIEAAGVQPGERVLDVGCGPGYLARLLARAVGRRGAVVGVDASPEMVEYATRRSRGLANCRFQAGSAESLDLPDAGFDVVVSSLMLHHLPEAMRLPAVREMRRVLRPGGRLVLADFAVPDRGPWHLLAALTGHSGPGAHGARRGMLARVSPLEPVVAAAGFTDLRTGDAPPWLRYVAAARG